LNVSEKTDPRDERTNEVTEDIKNPKTTPEREYPNDLALVPLREMVVFPKLVVPLGVGREKSVAAITAAMSEERHLVVLARSATRRSTTSSPSRSTPSEPSPRSCVFSGSRTAARRSSCRACSA